MWSERLKQYLLPWHVAAFWIGFIFDISGTFAMHKISEGPFNIFEPHTFTGQLALWLMFVHAIWATVTVSKGYEELRRKFHKYSLIVWTIWLFPYFGGMYLGMTG